MPLPLRNRTDSVKFFTLYPRTLSASSDRDSWFCTPSGLGLRKPQSQMYIACGLMWQNILQKMLFSPFPSLPSLSAAVSTSSWELILKFWNSFFFAFRLMWPYYWQWPSHFTPTTAQLRRCQGWEQRSHLTELQQSSCIDSALHMHHILLVMILSNVRATVGRQPPLSRHLTEDLAFITGLCSKCFMENLLCSRHCFRPKGNQQLVQEPKYLFVELTFYWMEKTQNI